MRQIVFEESAFQDFVEWATVENKMFQRLVHLVIETLRQPFSGLGKPEPLKHALRGYWSRRINDEHRLVYKVTNESIIIVSRRYHYRG